MAKFKDFICEIFPFLSAIIVLIILKLKLYSLLRMFNPQLVCLLNEEVNPAGIYRDNTMLAGSAEYNQDVELRF